MDTEAPFPVDDTAPPGEPLNQGPTAEGERVDARLLALLENVVRAIHAVERRMGDLETKTQRAAEAAARDKEEVKADIATLRTRSRVAESAIDQMQIRLAAAEASTTDLATRQTCELDVSRAAVDGWRQSAEKSEASLLALGGRLSSVEAGLSGRLAEAVAAADHGRARCAALEADLARSGEEARTMEARLSDAVGAITDQRARIACLQAKLGARTRAQRYVEDSTALRADPAPADIVIDLVTVVEERRISA